MATKEPRGRRGDGSESGSCGGDDGARDFQESSDVASGRPLDAQNDLDPAVEPEVDGSTPDGNSVSPEDSNDVAHRTWEDVGMYQGYTPLTDDALWTGEGAVLATTSHEEDGNANFHGTGGGGGGVFFADMSAFFQAEKDRAGADQEASTSDASSDSRDGDDHQDAVCDGDPPIQPDDDSRFDFRSVADRALAALDREYEQVASVPSRQQEFVAGAPNEADSFLPNRSMAEASGQACPPAEREGMETEPPRSTLPSSGASICKGETNRSSDGDHHFEANFDLVADESGARADPIVDADAGADVESTCAATRPAPAVVDVEAVQRAVQSIQSKRPGFASQVDEWEAAQPSGEDGSTKMHALQLLLAVAPMEHALIPPAPLKAFRRRTAKAVAATATLTRSATIAEALRRLDLLQSQDRFVIHVVGCDSVECQSEERVRVHFGPIVNWVASYLEAPRNLSMVLLGPNIPASAPSVVQLLTPPIPSSSRRLESAEIRCVRGGLYHECLAAAAAAAAAPRDESFVPPPWLVPDLVVAFHAGIWGYSTWEATFAHHVEHSDRQLPWVITSYTIQEAEDDAEALEGILLRQPPKAEAMGAAFVRVWPPEWNPYASQQARETATAPQGRLYRENAAWSCWKI